MDGNVNAAFPAVRRTSDFVPSRSSFTKAASWRKSSDTTLEETVGPRGLTTIHQPLQHTVADLVFVHGLGGGSRKTWTLNGDPSLFWPQEWLPEEPDFQDVRIHTFGYDSNWDKGSILNVNDFATSLLEWISNCPEIASDTDKPIVFVCHSMGGLVAKQAYLLARQSSKYERVGSSIRSIVFLATPHRGSDLAETLSRILSITGIRPFVNDLHPGSTAIQSINEEFPRFSDGLQLQSFYETRPMQIGLKKTLVVTKESAILGYQNERSTYLEADHRHVCKFESRNSINYQTVRNSLAKLFQSLRSAISLPRRNSFPEQQQVISATLDIQDPPEDDFLRADSLKLPGSCEWITKRKSFATWRSDGFPHVYWVTAKPGAGKSILCGHVMNYLREQSLHCSFFFFNYGDKQKSTLSTFVRSMAWQVASSSPNILEHMAKTCQRNLQILQADYRTIWRKLFIECIFKYPLDSSHFWVVDALDECRQAHELVPLLMQAATVGGFRVFLTSRTAFSSYGITRNPQCMVHTDMINEETTNSDIKLYLQANMEHLSTRDQDYTAKLLLEKSDGCFLWTTLALQELRQGLTRSGIQRILADVPSDMSDLYNRIIQNMFKQAREKDMIKAILDWISCAARPLTTQELHHALKLDMDDEIDGDVEKFVATNCGQLVTVDKTNCVRMVHLTARDFLFSSINTTAAFDRATIHKRLAMACLKYLSGPEMVGPRPGKLGAHHTKSQRGLFVSYAATALFEHINFVHSDDDDFANALGRFLKLPNVLSWIEHIAQHSDLSRLLQAGLALRKYTARRTQKTLPFGKAGKDNALFDKWATDMIRLVTKFGSYLRASPASILQQIAPFCPLESAIRAQFASSNRSIRVAGVTSTTWDDCASTIILNDGTLNTIATASGLFAVGLQGGHIVVYDERVCQEVSTLDHVEPVKKLLFGSSEPVLIAAGLRTITVWNAENWTRMWTSKLGSQLISLALTDNDKLLLATNRSNQVQVWETSDGEEGEPTSWIDVDLEDGAAQFRRPMTTAISADQSLVAVVYRGEDIVVWDILHERVHDVFGKDEGSFGPAASPRKGVAIAFYMIFNKGVVDARLLVVAYNDGVLNLFNTDEGTLQARVMANAHTFVSSNDGLTLACGDSGGMIQIFEFETLKILYKIQADQTTIKHLAFSTDDQRILGVQNQHCYVWEPPVLIRQTVDEENSDTISVSTNPQDVKIQEPVSAVSITVLAVIEPGKLAICGKDDGSVSVWDTTSGKQESELLLHTKNLPISELEFDALSSVLASVDVSSRIMVHRLAIKAATGCFFPEVCLLDTRVGTAVTQILLNEGANRLLISTEQEDILVSLQTHEQTQSPATLVRIPSPDVNRHRKWLQHPQRADQIILITADSAQLFSWSTLECLTPTPGIHLSGVRNPSFSIISSQQCFDDAYLVLTFAESTRPYSRREVHFYPTGLLTPDTTTINPELDLELLAEQIHAIIGNTSAGSSQSHRLVFLLRDGYICSAANASSFDSQHYDRHHPLPPDWLSNVSRLCMAVSQNGTLLFVRRDELICIRRGFEYFEGGQSRALMKRPSMKANSLSQDSITEDNEESIRGRKKSGALAERLRRTRSSRSRGET